MRTQPETAGIFWGVVLLSFLLITVGIAGFLPVHSVVYAAYKNVEKYAPVLTNPILSVMFIVAGVGLLSTLVVAAMEKRK